MKKIFAILILAVIITACTPNVKVETKVESSKSTNDGIDYSAIPEKTVLLEGFELPSLGYAYNALEPYIDAKTVHTHYEKHTKGYYKKFINAVKDTELANIPLDEIMKTISNYDPFIIKNAGQYYNHVFYWENLSPDGGQPSAELMDAINKSFGSFEAFKEEFSKMGKTQFGSGWAWLNVDDNGKLFVSNTPNEINPLMDIAQKQGTPILTMDVWEHAYYLTYQNLRGDYIESFYDVIDWGKVNERFESAQRK